MAVDIKLKRSSVPGKIPTTASLELGEIALNTYDGKAYMKKQVGNVQSIIEIGSGSGGGGGVTSVSVTSANGFAGTVANPTTTPAITILTSVVGIMKGNGSAASAAVAGTDYITPTQGTASWALNAVNAITASYFSGSIANAITASYALTATSASYASSSTSASYANTSVSASYANNATSASYSNNATSASYAQNATTASYAQNTISASYASSSTSASYAVNATSASYANNATSASYALNATSASYAVSAAYAPPPVSVSYAETASYAGNFTVAGTITAQTLVVQVITSSQELITGSLIVSGSLNAYGGVTGSLLGTASWANNATSASYALTSTSASYASASTSASYAFNATSASYTLFATSASYASSSTSASYASSSTSASYASSSTSASYAVFATSASYAFSSTSASYASASTSASYASSSTSASYALFTDSASYASTSTSASYANVAVSASYASSSTSASYALIATSASYASSSTSASYALFATSASYASASTSASYAISSTSASYASASTSASYAVNATSASYALFATSASYALASTSASYASASTSASYASSSTSASYASASTSASYASSSTSASYAVNSTSASYAFNATSASYSQNATSASYAVNSTSASYALNTTSASYASASTSASYAQNATSASYSNNSTSASYSLVATSASYALASTSASYSQNATSASYALNATSASYAVTASYSIYAQTASYATNITISGSIANVDYIDFDLTASFAAALGRLGYDSGEGTLQFGIAGGNVTLNIGEDLYQYVYNAETSSMTKGQVVFISGSQGNRIAVKLASATNEYGSANTLGFVAETIAAGAEGWVMTEGNLRKLNTVGLIGGELLYLGTTPGTYTQTPPVAPNHGVRLGYAERIDSTVGSIYVKIDNGYELGELHNVVDSSNTGSYGDLFIKSGSVWINSRQLTGSYGLTGSLTAISGGFTGSLLGTASYAINALSASYSLFATSASYASASTSASYAATATTAAFASSIANGLNISASNINISNNLVVNGTASFNYVSTVTGSAIIIGQEYIILNTQLPAARFAGLKIYDSGSNVTSSFVYDSLTNHWVYQQASGSTYSGGAFISGPINTGSLGDEQGLTQWRVPVAQGFDHIMDSQIYSSGSTTQITGSLTVTAGITGSLQGTASWANNATTASYALTATSASYANNSTTASYASASTSASYASASTSASFAATANSSSYAINAGFAFNSTSASYANVATSASYALNSTTASYALTATSASYSNNSTSASYANNATSASYANTAGVALSGTGSFTGSFNGAHTGSLLGTASWANNATTASYALTSTSASYALNATTASYALVATSASYSQNSTSASYALNSTSASYALTASYVPSVSGTTNYVAKFTAANTVGNSVIYDNGTSIGIGTTAPSAKLDIVGSSPGLAISFGTTVANNPLFINTYGGWSGIGMDQTSAGIRLVGDYNASTLPLTDIGYYSAGTASHANWVSRLIVKQNGSVGVGITNPSQKLHINGGNLLVASTASGSGADANSGLRIVAPISTTHYNWMLGAQQNVNAAFEITPSSATGSITFNTPVAVFTAGGNVGIGTVSPVFKLQIGSTTSTSTSTPDTISIGGTYSNSAGSNAKLRIWTDGTNTMGLGVSSNQLDYILTSTSYDHVFYANASALMIIKGGGNVGIGTTNPSSTYGRLTVAGTGITIADDGNAKLQIGRYSAGASNSYIKLGANSNSLRVTNNTDIVDIFTIENGGNVGIGTTSPLQKLQVAGNIGLGSTSAGYTESGSKYIGSSYTFPGTDGFVGFQIESVNAPAPYNGNYSQNLKFFTHHYNASTGGTPRMTIQYNGNVGIGTTGPSSKLHLYESTAADVVLRLTPSDGNYDPLIQLTGQGNSITDEGFEIWYVNNVGDVHLSTTYANDAASIHFHTRTGASKSTSNERLTILGGGNIGINSTAPAAKLDIKGNLLIRNAQFEATSSATSGATTIATIATGSYKAAFVDYVAYSGSNQRAGTFISNWNGSNIQFTDYSTVDIGTTSAVTMSAVISGGNALIRATTPASWTVTATYRTI